MKWHSFRNALQSVHLWAGLILSIPFILIGLSGSIIVLVDALPDYQIPAATAVGQMQPIPKIIEAAKPAVPEGWSVAGVSFPRGPRDPAGVQLQVPPGRRPPPALRNVQGRTIWIDPVSLKILGDVERLRAGDMKRALTTMHIALMVPNYFGVRLVGWMGIAMTLFGLTGLVLWWPRRGQWRYAFGVKRGARGFRLHHDLHGAVGFWSLAVFLIVSISGVYLAFPVTVTNIVNDLTPVKTTITSGSADAAALSQIAGSGPFGPDEAVKLALAAVPDAAAYQVQLPAGDSGVYMVTLVPNPYGWDAPQISVFVGPGAQVSDVVDPRTYTFGKRILVWLRVMHYGQGLGIVWQVLVFFSGFLPLLFGITGLRMWQIKRAQRRGVPAAIAVPAE